MSAVVPMTDPCGFSSRRDNLPLLAPSYEKGGRKFERDDLSL